MIGNPAITAVADMIFSHQILLAQIIFCSVSGGMSPVTPEFWKAKQVIVVQQINQCAIEFFGVDMTAVDKGQHMTRNQSAHMPGGLRRTKIAAVCKERQKIPFNGTFELRVGAGERSESITPNFSDSLGQSPQQRKQVLLSV